MENKRRKQRQLMCGRMLLLMLLFIPLYVGAQSSSTITGTVNDMQGEPLIGANVRQKGTNNGTVTDLSGHFSIKVPAGAMLIVSYVGFNEQEVKAQSNMVITLSDEAKSIDGWLSWGMAYL